MTGRLRKVSLLFFACVLWVATINTVDAHGVHWQQEKADNALVLAFEYSDGTKIAFAEVKVVDPDKRTFQKGRTDREGRFAMAGNSMTMAGEWQVTVNDGQGHVVNVPMRIDENRVVELIAPMRSEVGLLPRVLFGFSLIANVTVLAFWFAGRRRKRLETSAI